MNLYLSRRSHLNSVYMLESGQVLYKVVTPYAINARNSTVHKVIPNIPDAPQYDDFGPARRRNSEDDSKFSDLSDDALKDKFSVVGVVEHRPIGKSVLEFHEGGIQACEYFRKDGYNVHAYNRVFTGPDGREYKWYMKATYCHLCLNDEAQTSIARFHPKSLGIVGKMKHPAYLEISQEGLHMLDTILITFLYTERKRQDG